MSRKHEIGFSEKPVENIGIMGEENRKTFTEFGRLVVESDPVNSHSAKLFAVVFKDMNAVIAKPFIEKSIADERVMISSDKINGADARKAFNKAEKRSPTLPAVVNVAADRDHVGAQFFDFFCETAVHVAVVNVGQQNDLHSVRPVGERRKGNGIFPDRQKICRDRRINGERDGENENYDKKYHRFCSFPSET